MKKSPAKHAEGSRDWLPNLPPHQLEIWRRVAASASRYQALPREWLEGSIVDRFEQLCRIQPSRLAVMDKHLAVSYTQLNALANALAHAFLESSSSQQSRVGILLDKGSAFIAACLAALKAGKLFVPLDPTLPEARLAYILDDTKPSVVVTDETYTPLARQLGIDVKALLNVEQVEPTAMNLALRIPPNHLAWVLYTSGSTGKPKGVLQNHCNVLHYVRNYANYFCITPEDRLSLLFLPSVNGAAHDIFAALLTGASIHSYDVRKEGLANIGQWLTQNEITVYCSAPTVFSHFVDTLSDGESFPAVRLVRFIGEPVYRRHVEMFKRHFSSNCVLVNRLGSTETGSALFYFLNGECQFCGNRVPVGYPVEGNDVYLLGTPDPQGIREIAVRSAYLSPGYWNRPELTVKSFVPVHDRANVHTYAMGDLGYKDERGAFVHAGRTDLQVKIRGHRVEIAEVEAMLLSMDAVKEGVITARKTSSNDHYLVAYIVPAANSKATVSDYRTALAAKLPSVMVPTKFVLLERFPQAPNGKIDRKKLPAPSRSRPELAVPFVAPRTELERRLTAILGELLEIDEIGIDDNFLDLGGDSLVAARFASRVAQDLDAELAIAEVLGATSLAQLAEGIQTRAGACRQRP